MGNHLVEVLLQHDALGEQLLGVRPGEDGVELAQAFDHFLAASSAGMNRFEADRAALEQVLRRRARVLQRKYAETIENDVAHAFGKQR